MKHFRHFAAIILLASISLIATADADPAPAVRTLSIDFAKPGGVETPRVGFLGGLRDDTPAALLEPLHPAMFRIGHQFRGRIAGGLPAAIARVHSLGATYKLVMSDLIKTPPTDFASYEADVKKLVAETGDQAGTILWEPANEPDISFKPIDKYYELYAHAFKALREARPDAQITGPGFAFPSYDKYKAFLDYCRENHLECNDLCWHYTGWDPESPRQQKWHLEQLPDLAKAYPDQKIREIHCDEWGAGPDKPSVENPGRLQPGRAVIWFYYLQNVYHVDRACRANWGHADDYLGGLITPANETYPAYFAYRFYGSMSGAQDLQVAGSNHDLAALAVAPAAGKSPVLASILLGSIEAKTEPVRIELRNLPSANVTLHVKCLPNKNLAAPMTEAQIPTLADIKLEQTSAGSALTLPAVEENQAYLIQIVK